VKERPIGVTILAILAGVAAVLAAIHALQFLGIFPFFIGHVAVRTFNFFYALMYLCPSSSTPLSCYMLCCRA